ncbi:MAG: amino acid adenylation domain-containing protein [Verrucomicrobiales bacterium]|nr:amino acid adenylation domain-containing protein [Verrucomicrobiales bacterium]
MVQASQWAPQDGLYVQQLVIEFQEPLDAAAWHAAWEDSIRRHKILRTQFRASPEGRLLQEVLPTFQAPITHADCAGLSRDEAELRLEAFLDDDRLRGLATESGPPWRLHLFHWGPTEWRCVWTSHHALLDGRSRCRLLREWSEAYERLRSGRYVESPDGADSSPLSFLNYARWLAAQDPGASRTYFGDLLSGFSDPTPLPMARRSSTDSVSGSRHAVSRRILDENASRRLAARAQEWDVSVHNLIQGAWAILLGQYSGEDDVVFGGVRACRHSGPSGTVDVVGLLVNTLPVRVRLPRSMAIPEWIQSLRSQWQTLRAHETTPLAQIQAWSHRDAGQPLLESVVMFENSTLEDALRDAGGGESGRRYQLRAATGYPLVVSAFGGQRIRMDVVHDRRRLGDAEADLIADALVHLLDRLVDGSSQVLGDLYRISGCEERRLEAFQNSLQGEVPSGETIAGRFENQCALDPDSVALVHGGVTWSYVELNTRANRWARRLVQQGVVPGRPVAVGLERGLEWVAAVLGVLKAGGVFLPLDPEYPADRIRWLLEDSGAAVCVIPGPTFPGVLEGTLTIVLPEDLQRDPDPDPGNPPSRVTADDPACILYTSGSTGRPKGVTVPHRGILRLVVDADYVDLGPVRTLLQVSPPTFDASSFELWGALLNGGRCVLYPGRIPTLPGLRAQLTEHGVDTLWLTAALFNLVVDEDVSMLRGVRQLLTGGEALSVSHVRRALSALPETRLINGYGPTEATTFATTFNIPRELSADVESIPIGRPIRQTRVRVLDAARCPVPFGAVGELWISGPGVSPGYWNQPERTAERFHPDPTPERPTAVCYRTGDRVRWRPDGVLEFLGRTDGQLKIRGHRVEPGELEEVMRNHPEVLDAVVAGRELVSGAGLQLVAYVVPRNPLHPPSQEELLMHCGDRLPSYLCPTHCVLLPQLPRTENGKVDRARLPQPAPQREVSGPEAADPNSLEGRLAGLFSEVLGGGPVRPDEDFFRLGGHSLLAMVLAARVRKTLGITLDPAALAHAPSPDRLAARIRQGSHRIDFVGGPERRVPRDAWHPLLRTQYSLWNVLNRYPGRQMGNFHRAFRLQGKLDSVALRQACVALVERHEAWRSQFQWIEGRPSQRVLERFRLEIPETDLSALPLESALVEVSRRQEADIRRPFDAAQGAVFRSELIRLGSEDHVLLLGIDHLVFDAWTYGILVQELGAAYEAFRQGRDWSPEPLSFQPVDLGVWEQEMTNSPGIRRQIQYWRDHLSQDFRWPALRHDGSGHQFGSFDSDRAQRRISEPLVAVLRRISVEQGVTLSQTLFTVMNITLHRLTGQSDLIVAAPLAARHRPGTEGIAGCLRVRAQLRTDLGGNPPLNEMIGRVRTTFHGAMANPDVTLELAFPERGVEHPAYWTQCPIDFNFRDGLDSNPTLSGLTVSVLTRPLWTIYPQMSLQVLVNGGAVDLILLGRICCYSAATRDRILDAMLDTVSRVVANPSARLNDFAG